MALYLTRRLTSFHQSLTRHSYVGQLEPSRFTFYVSVSTAMQLHHRHGLVRPSPPNRQKL